MKLSAVLAAKGTRVFTTTPDTSIQQAITELAENNIGALIVLDRQGGAPVGILSERDIIRRMAAAVEVRSAKVGDLMSSPIVTGSSEDDADSVLRTMTTKRFRHLPVVDAGQLVGMVTIGDLVKAELVEFRGAVETLETQLMES
jgi:CBS domain-containing protein